MTCCWSMTITDRPPAKEAVQFIGSALHTSTSPQRAVLPLAARITATSSSKPPSSGMKGKENEKGGYQPKGPPKEEEMEDESGEDDDNDDIIQVSRSLAQRWLQAIIPQRALGGGIASQHAHTHVAEKHVAPAAQFTAPIPLGHLYDNLPAPAKLMMPRTTGQIMFSTELSESMRRQLLWERQVNSTTNPAANARRANNWRARWVATACFRQLPWTRILAQLRVPRLRIEMSASDAARARIRGWADEYHYSGW
ncbi:hypothetical protein EDD22DRAFT_913817 [Suillus occidentalis]|nr:hypothetical protein EDD22DRAFT_913817 [Suillus occidentalis]